MQAQLFGMSEQILVGKQGIVKEALPRKPQSSNQKNPSLIFCFVQDNEIHIKSPDKYHSCLIKMLKIWKHGDSPRHFQHASRFVQSYHHLIILKSGALASDCCCNTTERKLLVFAGFSIAPKSVVFIGRQLPGVVRLRTSPSVVAGWKSPQTFQCVWPSVEVAFIRIPRN